MIFVAFKKRAVILSIASLSDFAWVACICIIGRAWITYENIDFRRGEMLFYVLRVYDEGWSEEFDIVISFYVFDCIRDG